MNLGFAQTPQSADCGSGANTTETESNPTEFESHPNATPYPPQQPFFCCLMMMMMMMMMMMIHVANGAYAVAIL